MNDDEDFIYKHTQRGGLLCWWVGLCAAAPAGAFGCALLGLLPEKILFGTGSTAAVCAVVFVVFRSLTVVVTKDEIRIRFGVGVVRKTFQMMDVEACSVVTNRWWYGWGIKRGPGFWLYNIGGFDAVELKFLDGRRTRIGSDQPEQLASAIESVSMIRETSRQ